MLGLSLRATAVLGLLVLPPVFSTTTAPAIAHEMGDDDEDVGNVGGSGRLLDLLRDRQDRRGALMDLLEGRQERRSALLDLLKARGDRRDALLDLLQERGD